MYAQFMYKNICIHYVCIQMYEIFSLFQRQYQNYCHIFSKEKDMKSAFKILNQYVVKFYFQFYSRLHCTLSLFAQEIHSH